MNTVQILVKCGLPFARVWAELEFVTRLLQDQGSSSQTLSILLVIQTFYIYLHVLMHALQPQLPTQPPHTHLMYNLILELI